MRSSTLPITEKDMVEAAGSQPGTKKTALDVVGKEAFVPKTKLSSAVEAAAARRLAQAQGRLVSVSEPKLPQDERESEEL